LTQSPYLDNVVVDEIFTRVPQTNHRAGSPRPLKTFFTYTSAKHLSPACPVMPSFCKTLVALTSLAIISMTRAMVYGPVISSNFPDPAILVTSNGTYAFATNSNNINIQVATSPDGGTTWELLSGVDALPNVGSWATANSTWAPDVIDRGDGTFVMCRSSVP